MRHRQIEVISETLLTQALARAPLNQFVVWTGDPPNCREGSLRARAFACVQEVWRPLSLRAMLQRAARLDGDRGLHPEIVREGVRQHQSAKPAVLWLLERQPSGDFTAVTDIMHAGDVGLRIPAGALVINRTGQLCPDHQLTHFDQGRPRLSIRR